MPDFNLDRFLLAQRATYDVALKEIGARKKRTHWMWFIFPQIRGLGSSPTSIYYAIENADEARSYLDHPVLCARLSEITSAMNQAVGNDATAILGSVDAAKFRSSMTLFHLIDPENECFGFAIEKFFGGVVDDATVRRLLPMKQRSAVLQNQINLVAVDPK